MVRIEKRRITRLKSELRECARIIFITYLIDVYITCPSFVRDLCSQVVNRNKFSFTLGLEKRA